MKFCTKCGHQLSDSDNFCSACGATQTGSGISNSNATESKSFMDSFTEGISKMTGGTGSVRPPFKSIFSKIFTKHEQSEAEEIFICGTKATTPELTDNGKAWPSPWLYSRIFLAFAAAFVLLYICCANFENSNALPGLMVVGSFMIPISVLMFFFELNTPKNISFFTIIKYFLIGGCASLVITLALNDIFASEMDEWESAVFTGIVEEVAKLAIVAIVIWKKNNVKYALNGLLIGAAIGAGFAAFESAGYAFNVFFSQGYDAMVDNILLRAFLAPGGHVIWAAMSGYAIIFVREKNQSAQSFLSSSTFWKVFWIPIVLHSVWDMPIVISETFLGQIAPVTINMIIGWIVVFVLIGNSLTQLGKSLQQNSGQVNSQ